MRSFEGIIIAITINLLKDAKTQNLKHLKTEILCRGLGLIDDGNDVMMLVIRFQNMGKTGFRLGRLEW